MSLNKFLPWATIVLVLIALYPSARSSSTKFTNLKCEDHDLAFSRFEKCKLSVAGRGLVSLNVIVNLLKTPITNITLNFGMYKKASGYRPFLYNMSVNMCQYFVNQNKFPVLKILLGAIVTHSNINHTCPYSGDVIVRDLIVDERSYQYFPLPDGDYLIKGKVYAYNDLKATVHIFFSRKE